MTMPNVNSSAWRAALQPASFRGVPFVVSSARAEGLGRRIVVHEYAQRDESFPEDLGRDKRVFLIEAYVVGADYMRQRDALEAALAKEGAGELVHPKRGRLMVRAAEASCTEESAQGGMATFQIRFELDGANVLPDTAADTQANVASAADAASTAVQDGFIDGYSTDNVPQFVRDSALGDIADALTGIGNMVRSVTPDIGQLGSFVTETSGVGTQLSNIIGTPLRVATEVLWQIGHIAGIAQRPQDAFTGLTRLFGHGNDYKPIAQTTPARRQQAANRAATIALVQRASVIEAARASSAVDFESSDAALAARDLLDAQLDAHMSSAPDDVYQALADLRVAVVRDLTDRGASLARISTVTMGQTMPAALIAYRVYGDAARGDEIVARNSVRHPLFVPGGQALEVLLDA